MNTIKLNGHVFEFDRYFKLDAPYRMNRVKRYICRRCRHYLTIEFLMSGDTYAYYRFKNMERLKVTSSFVRDYEFARPIREFGLPSCSEVQMEEALR